MAGQKPKRGKLRTHTIHVIFHSADDDKVYDNVIHAYTKGDMRRFVLDEEGPDGWPLLMKHPIANIFSEASTHRHHFGSTLERRASAEGEAGRS